MIIEIVAGAVVGPGLVAAGAALARRFFPEIQTEEKIVYQQRCFYCKIDIVGEQTLDVINHGMCITRSPEEIAKLVEQDKKAKAKKPEASAGKYLIDIVQEIRKKSDYSDYSGWEYATGGKWVRYHWTLYRDGDWVDEGVEKTKAHARQRAEFRKELDTHRHTQVEC